MKIIDYVLTGTSVSNPDGTMPATVTNCAVVSGPGAIISGTFPKSLDFGTKGKVHATLNPANIQAARFCLRVVFKIDSNVTTRQNLVESTCLPFSMFIDKAGNANNFKIVVSVSPKEHGWSGTNTEFFKELKTNTWYTADLMYDTDTLAVFIDGIIISVHAYPFGTILKSAGNQLFIGTWTDGARNHFGGQIAAVQWYDDEIPPELESQLDERRSHPEWFLSYKQEALNKRLNIGNILGRYNYDNQAGAYVQQFASGLIMYNESVGAAFEMHGAIFLYYINMTNKAELGYLVSDEVNTAKAGGRKNIFSKGGLYWSPSTGTFPVTGQMYINYEQFGESSFIGWPVSAASAVNNGKEQIFQVARMYFKHGTPSAFEVHGAILAKFLATGGINVWGYPVTNESDIKNGASVIGKCSDFENCTIYWSGATGAFEVHGDIRRKYKELNGPLGQMGFPTSDEGNIPGGTGGSRFNTFQNGSILWFGNYSNMYVCQAFKIFLGRINSKESEGAFMGQNDLYLRAFIRDNGAEILNKRFPNSGDYDGKNIVDINSTLGTTIVPNSPNRNIRFTVDVWESDGGAPFGGGDDHLGTYNKDLNMANAWGMDQNNGIYNTGSFQGLNSITWSVKPQVNPNLLATSQKWWGVKNQGTSTISYANYAAAFRDVDSESEWWDLTDWLEKAFYELVAKGIAGGGNCFGMSVEGIYAYKQRSLFSLPIDRFTNWNTVANEFNVKHQYQVGAAGIWWFVGEFLSGNTHDPVDVFNETRREFNRGCDPVICIAQNYDFSGKPHCILPIAWDSSTKPWKITILDPNFKSDPTSPASNITRTLFVNPDNNTFSYDGGNMYSGGEWSGGRFHYMPYSVTGERPRTPIWDAIVLILLGTIIILGSDTETVSLVDENGNDLDAFGPDSINRLKQNKSLDNKFVSVKGFGAKKVASVAIKTKTTSSTIKSAKIRVPIVISKPKGIIASEMYLRTEKTNTRFDQVFPGLDERIKAPNLTLGDMLVNKKFAATFNRTVTDKAIVDNLKNRNLTHAINDSELMARLTPSAASAFKDLVTSTSIGKNFKHQLRGLNNGQMVYAIKNKLNEFRLQAAIKASETSSIETKDLGTSSSVVKMFCNENKTVKLEINNKLGVGKDNMKIVIDKIPIAVGKELNLNIKPGLSGLDILTVADKVNATVSIETNIGGKLYKSNYGVDIEGGIRIRPSTILTGNELKVGKIDNLFGQFRDSRMIKKK